MAQDRWTAVDRYLSHLFARNDAALEAALRDSADAGLPSINVSANQGKMLQVLAQALGARNILEIGTLGGYSTIWLARAWPPDGRLTTLEADPRHAEVGRRNFARAGLASVIELHVGRALDLLPRIAAEARGPFDLTFIDADKENYADYFSWALKLSRRGSLIIADNVVRNGAVIDDRSSDSRVQGVRRMNELVAKEPRVSAAGIQTVGGKGYDGFMVMLVTAGRRGDANGKPA